MKTLSSHEVDRLASTAVDQFLATSPQPLKMVFGIPRGGMPVAYKIAWELERRRPSWPTAEVHPVPEVNHFPVGVSSLVVDDIVDTGQTILKYAHRPTLALVTRDAAKGMPDFYGLDLKGDSEWVRFPWDEVSGTPEDAVVRILEFLGMDPQSPSLQETPRRFLSWLSEFRANQPMPEMTIFSGITYDQMILVKDIPFVSLCSHHLMAFSGTASVAYIPSDSNVIGLSKIARLVEWRAKRLQVQERLTEEIMAVVKEATSCLHVGVIIKAEHTCMSLRGPKALGHATITSALSGDFREDQKTREEFLKLAGV